MYKPFTYQQIVLVDREYLPKVHIRLSLCCKLGKHSFEDNVNENMVLVRKKLTA